MTPEMIAIIAVGVTLVGMNLHSSREIRAEMRREIGALGERLDALAARIGALEQRLVRIEGSFEGVLRGRVG